MVTFLGLLCIYIAARAFFRACFAVGRNVWQRKPLKDWLQNIAD